MYIAEPIQIGKKIVKNRIAIQPMEGNDADEYGNPGELTFKRYEKLAEGDAGLIIIEACAVDEPGKARKNQLILKRETSEKFKELIKRMKSINPEVIIFIQLNHSGKLSLKPINFYSLTKENIISIEDKFVEATNIAKNIGADGIDFKACHGYLGAEFLSPENRRQDEYGGTFENRTRFYRETVEKIIKKIKNDGSFILGSRFSVYEGISGGFGVNTKDISKIDLTEPIKFVKLMKDSGMHYVNISIGIPAINPYISRPSRIGKDVNTQRKWTEELIKVTGKIKKEAPELLIIGTGYSYFLDKGVEIAEKNLKNGFVDIIGFGRMSFAYPDFPRNILNKGILDKKKICITCGKCGELLKAQQLVGCVIRNPFYKKIYSAINK